MDPHPQSPVVTTTRQDSTLTAKDGHQIPIYRWAPSPASTAPLGVVHVCHGMAEHAGRYEELAKCLSECGLVTIAHDHRGHGRCVATGMAGLYADDDGWSRVTGDVGDVQAYIAKEYPSLPVFLLGHSMGSFIVQGYLIENSPPPSLTGLILSGSNLDKPVRLKVLHHLVTLIRLWRGKHGISPLIHKLTFAAFAKSVSGAETEFDWLSSDRSEVQDYIDDPLCGFQCTVQLWHDFTGGLATISQPANLAKIPTALPVYLLAGERDPVGAFGTGPRLLAEAYRQAGHTDVELSLYPSMRHEPFHEHEHEAVFADLWNWLERHLRRSEGAAAP
ncbi:alpha/beta fold hydrolase [Mangrovitalea sediminis]|uniref:alpha/beta fold hydrolase n=1 Tax=Mangrovitalea sediminis TaxID=1982043 RepID=UPI000BE5BB28|nr:alpha/beta fold hydrolase [Mangrovitalea sediminis]